VWLWAERIRTHRYQKGEPNYETQDQREGWRTAPHLILTCASETGEPTADVVAAPLEDVTETV